VTVPLTSPLKKNRYALAAIFLVSSLNLLLQVLLTRILALGQGYHFAFLVISLALLGFGASGSCLSWFKTRLKKTHPRFLIALPLFFALSLFINYLVLNNYFIDRYHLSLNFGSWFLLGCMILSLALPFFFSGLILGLIYTFRAKDVGLYYGADLIGASIGALSFIPLGFILPPHALYGCLMGLALMTSALFAMEQRKSNLVLTFGTLSIVILLFSLFKPLSPFQLSPYKSLSMALRYPESNNLSLRWNSFSQVNLITSPAVRYAPGLSLIFEGSLPEQKGVTVDGERLNGVTDWNGIDKEKLKFIQFLPSAVSYLGDVSPKHVLVINASGGLSILEAIYWGAEHVDVIEPNPLVIRAVNESFSSSPYELEKVSYFTEDPRLYLSRVNKKYDRIVISVSENPPATSTGLYGLTENYLFTVNSFLDMWDHLAEDGYLTVTRYLFFPDREAPRLTNILKEVIGKREIDHPEDHLIWIQSWGTSTLLAKKQAITKEDRLRIEAFCDFYGFENVTDKYLNFDEKKSYFAVNPPTDDAPFFFQFIRLSRIGELVEVLQGRWDILLEGGLIVWIVFGFALLFSFVFILVPLIVQKRIKTLGKSVKPILFYFLLLGLGFMFVEMALIHRSMLLFSHPSYAVAISVFIVLLSSGIGSLYFYRHRLTRRFPYLVFEGIIMACFFFYLFSSSIIQYLLPLPGAMRFVLLLVFFFPLGFLMGIPYAYGVKALSKSYESVLPWAWGMNATFSVMATILAMVFAGQWGYSSLFLVSAACYGLCLLFIPTLVPLSLGRVTRQATRGHAR